MYNGFMSLYFKYNSETIKSIKFSEILRPNFGLIDRRPLQKIDA